MRKDAMGDEAQSAGPALNAGDGACGSAVDNRGGQEARSRASRVSWAADLSDDRILDPSMLGKVTQG